MLFMSSDIKADTSCMGCCNRVMTGEACLNVTYENNGNDPGYLGLTPNFPAKIIPINLSEHQNTIYAKKGAYMVNIGEVDVECDMDCNCLTCCFAGLGCIRQRMVGTGTTFIAAGGTILQKELVDGEMMVVDNTSIVAYEQSVTLGVRFAGSPLMCCLGGEGMFKATLTGPGHIYIQSMSFDKYCSSVAPQRPPGTEAIDTNVASEE